MKKKSNHKKTKPNYIFLFLASFLGVVVAGSLFLSAAYIYQISTRGEVGKVINVSNNTDGSEEQAIEVIPFPGAQLGENTKEADGIPIMEEVPVTLAFGGDVMFDDSYSIMNYYRSTGGDVGQCFDEPLLSAMRSADVFMVNNEGTFTTQGQPLENKAYTFRSNPANVSILKEIGADIVSLANNHAYDFGEISLLDTMETLTGADIKYVGAGKNSGEAEEPVYFEAGETKIAIVSATQIERMSNPDTKGATETSPGVLRCFEPANFCEVIRRAKDNSDFVIVYVHWGVENTTQIDWAQQDQAILFEEAGADLIVGDHPHCLQGITYINETPVIYSLGNFWFNSKTVDTALLQITVSGNKITELSIFPCRQQACRTVTLENAERDAFFQNMRNLSPDVQIDSEGNIAQ